MSLENEAISVLRSSLEGGVVLRRRSRVSLGSEEAASVEAAYAHAEAAGGCSLFGGCEATDGRTPLLLKAAGERTPPRTKGRTRKAAAAAARCTRGVHIRSTASPLSGTLPFPSFSFLPLFGGGNRPILACKPFPPFPISLPLQCIAETAYWDFGSGQDKVGLIPIPKGLPFHAFG